MQFKFLFDLFRIDGGDFFSVVHHLFTQSISFYLSRCRFINTKDYAYCFHFKIRQNFLLLLFSPARWKLMIHCDHNHTIFLQNNRDVRCFFFSFYFCWVGLFVSYICHNYLAACEYVSNTNVINYTKGYQFGRHIWILIFTVFQPNGKSNFSSAFEHPSTQHELHTKKNRLPLYFSFLIEN